MCFLICNLDRYTEAVSAYFADQGFPAPEGVPIAAGLYKLNSVEL